MRVSGVVVLYNPSINVYDNIASYIDQVERLFVVDNSDKYNADLIELLKLNGRCVYLNNFGNKGIANALNLGARKSIECGFEYLLTMDQDSILPGKAVSLLLKRFHTIEDRIGIISPVHFANQERNYEFSRVPFTMTTGNILSLSAYIECGPFREEFFIDHVDHEYCLRLRSMGYQIIEVSAINLNHKPGKRVRFLSNRLLLSIHPPARLYYFVRNGFQVSKTYKSVFPEFSSLFARWLVKVAFKNIILSKNRLESIKMMIKGYQDFKHEKFGKL